MDNTNENIGGIELEHVIQFQTRIMFGAQFGRLGRKTKEDIIIACLRMGWNDAFRHTSKNVIGEGGKSVLEIESDKYKKENSVADYDDYICARILSKEILLNTFYAFAKAKDTEGKVEAVTNNFEDLQGLFVTIKKTDGDKPLCFGHFQKMFNIALKLYLCIYMCRKYLDLTDKGLFDDTIINNLKNADCPVDSVILKRLDDKIKQKNLEEFKDEKFSAYKWSKFGTDDQNIDGYSKVQKAISNSVGSGKSNLYFDFIEWK